jgi:hypothetical protein
MNDDVEAAYELARSAAAARFRIRRVEGEEHAARSWQRVTCHLHRDDVSWAAVPLLYVVAALSFGDARPRGSSEIDYAQHDEWRFGDLLQRLRFERRALVLETDYVRGRMMKTTVTIREDGTFVVETRNRHEMAERWLQALKGRRHIRLVKDSSSEDPD